MPAFFKSFSTRLALVFMFMLTGAVLLLSLVFILFTYSLVRTNQTMELKKSEQIVFDYITEQFKKENFWEEGVNTKKISADIPYFMTYIVYEADTEALIATNDPFLPFLRNTNGHSKRYFVKNYFFDGNLDIFYYAQLHKIAGKKIIVAVAMNLDTDNTVMLFSKLPLALFCMMIPILILSFFISLFITNKTIFPVKKITKAAQSVTVENLSDLLPLSGYDDEIDELSKTFNSLFLRLKQDFERERQFSSDVSHELNTPLTVISGQANLLLRWGKNEPGQLEKSLLAIKTEAKTMQSIIANLLQISRIESGRIKPRITRVELSELFSWLTEEFSAIEDKIDIMVEKTNLVLETDFEMLHQIMTILISNSIKYAGKDCKIFLNAFYREDKIVIEQKDNGPGFSKESLPHIFERFYRADEAHSRKIAGSGLGLAIAKTLCNALGAKISAFNAVPCGAGFFIEFSY